MLRKLRRNSKEPSEVTLSRSTTTASAEPTPAPRNESRISFFDLPAELRNSIYESAISDAKLSLRIDLLNTSSRRPKFLMKRKSKNSPAPPINGLLLASKQCRREYLSVLQSSIPVEVAIKDFDFEQIMRVSSSLRDQELRSLQSNRNLVLHLHTRNCTQKSLIQLRAWLEFRQTQRSASPSSLLPWQYEFPLRLVLPPTTMGKVRLLRELEYYADSIDDALALEFGDEDPRREELGRVIWAHEEKAKWLEQDVSWMGQRTKRRSRHVRGLAGGGLM